MATPRVRLRGRTILIISSVVVIVSLPISRQAVESMLTAIGRPLSGVGRWLNAVGGPWTQRRSLEAEVTQYRRQVVALSRRLNESEQRLETVQSVTTMNAYLDRAKRRAVLAPVVTTNVDPGVRSLVIGKGSADGLSTGLAVMTDDGIMVGKIQKVSDHLATVLLLTDDHSVVAARIQNDRRSQGLIRGERGLALRMDVIPKNDAVLSGQTVVTSGREPSVPPDLLIGSVVSTTARPGDLFQSAVVSWPVESSRLRMVSVITP